MGMADIKGDQDSLRSQCDEGEGRRMGEGRQCQKVALNAT